MNKQLPYLVGNIIMLDLGCEEDEEVGMAQDVDAQGKTGGYRSVIYEAMGRKICCDSYLDSADYPCQCLGSLTPRNGSRGLSEPIKILILFLKSLLSDCGW